MDIRAALKSQYHAAMKALRLTIERCPDSLWDTVENHQPPVWRVAYHTLFFSNYYLQKDHRDYVAPWPGHHNDFVDLGRVKDGVRIAPPSCGARTREQILEIWRICDAAIDAGIDALDLDATQCGFPWYTMPTLEHQLVNIRHIQHHTAALTSRLRQVGIEVGWVGKP